MIVSKLFKGCGDIGARVLCLRDQLPKQVSEQLPEQLAKVPNEQFPKQLEKQFPEKLHTLIPIYSTHVL